MSEIAIRSEGLGKKYMIGHAAETQASFRDAILRGAARFGRSVVDMARGQAIIAGDTVEEFWALRDIDFEVRKGDVLGVVGRNGAGKSTLLKILSRITEPTEGRVTINGRVSSLLEVGTGFHPELTGRENIFLNGAILGMSRAEIRASFDEIVDFAGIERFLDTPVKRYSSGMYVRLAFAVAAHLEPEILIVDEVLAVGDAAFQKKCLGKMQQVAGEGRTVLFVSHNVAAVNRLCSRGLLLEVGRLVCDDTSEAVTDRYLARTRIGDGAGEAPSLAAVGFGEREAAGLRVTGVFLANEASPEVGPRTGDPLAVSIEYEAEQHIAGVAFLVKISDRLAGDVIRISTRPISGFAIDDLHKRGVVTLKIDWLPLVSGQYSLDVEVFQEAVSSLLEFNEVLTFEVAPGDVYGSGLALDRGRGLVAAPHRWSHTLR